jgi:hypothetical protein
MKLTKSQLKQIIKEELQDIIEGGIGQYYARKEAEAKRLGAELRALEDRLQAAAPGEKEEIQKKIVYVQRALERARYTGD